MNKPLKKLLPLILTLVLVAGMLGTALAVPSAADQIKAKVTQLTMGKNTIYVYAPESELPVASATTAPCFMVFGDEPYTAESAEAEAIASGLAKIAAKEGATVVFINPQGDTWSEADKDIYTSMIDKYSNSTDGTNFVDGITKSKNFFTGQEETLILGGKEARIYLYAEGSGADFVAANYMKEIKLTTTFPDGVSMEFDRTATTITLFNPTTLPATTGPASLAVAVVNGPADTAEKLAGLTDKTLVSTSSVKDGFDGKWIADNYSVISGAYRSQAGRLLPMHDYAAEGIVESMESVQLKDGTTLNYIVYYDKELPVTGDADPVPLVLAFHGGGNSALFEAQATEWPEIAQAHSFIAVSVDLHFPKSTAAQTIELIDHLKSKYAIDASRIYASGFSMGSVKSWDLYEQFATVFAGLAPMDASEVPGTDSYGNKLDSYNTDVPVPLFFVGGQASPLPELANQDQKIRDRIDYAFKVNGVKTAYSYNADVNPWWGLNGDITYQVTDKVAFTDSTLNVNLFQSTDGYYYTALADASNQSHEVYARNSWAAWDFLSQFSRNADGSISIEPVTYTLPADDRSITSNSYNCVTYIDVDPDAPYAPAVEAVSEAGILSGMGDRCFAPNGTVTRAQAITAIGRLAGTKQAETADFTDVAANSWYSGYVGWAVTNGYVESDGKGHFFPNDLVSSEHLNLMLDRFAQANGLEVTLNDTGATSVTRADFAQRLAALLNAANAG